VVVIAAGGAHQPAWQKEELVGEFLDQRAVLLPLLDVQEDLLRRLFTRRGRAIGRFLDVGAGDGASSELLLDLAGDCQAVLVDFSEPMLSRAGQRLGRFGERWQAVRGDLREPSWHERLPAGAFDAAVSSYAIHHLTSERKRALFRELFDRLVPGAMFVNMDVVSVDGPLQGLFDEQMVANAVAAEHTHGGGRSHDEIERELLADEDEDRPDPLAAQLQWLGDAGFEQVEVHFKWAEGVIFGAVKPEGS
jgi:ubiquinone/menaquinone biosynthesis C-methylase UbiE